MRASQNSDGAALTTFSPGALRKTIAKTPCECDMRSLLRPARHAAKPILDWLRNVPIHDPIDRRNAPTMQLLLLAVGTTLPISWARHLLEIKVPTGWLWVMGADMVTSALAFVCVVFIRRGRFRPAVACFLVSLVAGLQIGYLKLGFQAFMVDQTSQMLLLVISGLMLSRRALWSVFAALMVIFFSGFCVDAYKAGVADAFHFLPSVIFSYVVVTLVLDRTITALRESLGEAEERGRLLQAEILERQRTHQQLIHSQKMEVAGRLASGVAHDFNNILGIVLGFTAERHRLDNPNPDAKRDALALADALEGVESAAQRGVALSRKLLSFGSPRSANAQVFDAREAIAELRPMLRQLFPATVLLEMKLGSDPLPICIDKAQFELVLLNVASNARDAMPDGGTFKVTAANDAETRSIDVVLADDGHGISKGDQVLVFDPFFTTKPAGNGLGLSIAQGLVSGAGGEIALHSMPGDGTTLRIRLPNASLAA